MFNFNLFPSNLVQEPFVNNDWIFSIEFDNTKDSKVWKRSFCGLSITLTMDAKMCKRE